MIFSYLKTNGIVVRCFPSLLRITAGTKAENAELIETLSRYFEERSGNA